VVVEVADLTLLAVVVLVDLGLAQVYQSLLVTHTPSRLEQAVQEQLMVVGLLVAIPHSALLPLLVVAAVVVAGL
jgi:hypothetical protein